MSLTEMATRFAQIFLLILACKAGVSLLEMYLEHRAERRAIIAQVNKRIDRDLGNL